MHHLSVLQSFSTVLSLQWALTHRSFPRILPDSSKYSRSYSQILFKAWCKNEFHQSHAFSKIVFQMLSLLAQPLCFSFSQSISVILVVFLVIIWRPKKSFSSKSCLFSRSFVVLVSCYPRELFRLSDILSYPSGVCQYLFFHFFLSEAIIPEEFFVLTFQLPLSNYPGASFKCSLISSWSLYYLASKSNLAYWLF